MAKTAVIDRPAPPREMGRIEAEAITKAIQSNFDSLGSMLLQARDEKAYRALGYRSFEGYCKNEFGKSKSSAYRSIEDAQVRAQLEAEISKQYDKPVSLNISSACLKPLKELPDTRKRLEAIDYANKIAEEEGRKPEKKDLEIAVFKIGGHRPDDFKKAIESLGFTQGTAVEVIATSRKDRGFVRKVDKRGKIYVELHNGGVTLIAYDSNQLRILGGTEKPVIPANDNTVSKGDRVKIFTPGLEGQTGEVYTWKMGKHAMVVVDGQSAPIDIPYAELELVRDKEIEAINVEVAQDNQWQDFNWIDGENHYYYFARENRIYNTSWPNNLTISPNTHSESPAKFLGDWMKQFAASIAKSLVNCDFEALQTENQKLREQLAEAEAVIKEMISLSKPIQPLENIVKISEAEPENCLQNEGEDADGIYVSAANAESWLSILEHNDFVKTDETDLDERPGDIYRDWDIYIHDSGVVDISHPKKGVFSADLSQYADTKRQVVKPVEWLKNIINQIEDFCPGQLSLDLNSDTASPTELPSEITKRIAAGREKILNLIEDYKKSKKGKSKEKEIRNINGNIEVLRRKIENLERFEKMRIGQIVCHERRPMILGKISSLEFSQGEMPCVCVRYFKDGELEELPISENSKTIFVLDL